MTKLLDIIRPNNGAMVAPAAPINLEVPRPRRGGPFGPYVLSPQLAATVNVAIALDQPLLVTGEPGCGKTALAWAVAAQLGCDVLYQVDSLRRFHDASIGESSAKDAAKYLAYRALGQAIRSPTTKVVLIDE